MKKSILKALLALTMLATLSACSEQPAPYCHDCDDKNLPDEPGKVVKKSLPAPISTVPAPTPAANTPASKGKSVVTVP